jgi:hypothetical protein
MSEPLVTNNDVLAADPAPGTSRLGVAADQGRRMVGALCALGVLVLFLAYYRLSRTAQVGSDSAADIFQAWDILHGNVLLHGWWLSDVSFYTTELPQYALIEWVLGPVPAVVHVAASMTYTLAVLLAAVLAKGCATGSEGALRMLIAAGIMLAPQPGSGTSVLDLYLGHIGTSVPLMVTWVVIDRAGARRWVPAAAGALLAWAMVADNLVLYVGVIPVVVVCSARAYRDVVIVRRPVTSARFEIAMALAALAAVPVSAAVLRLIHALGGFTVYSVPATLATGSTLPAHVTVTAEDVLTLFGADFLGSHMGVAADAALLHLTGVFLAGYAVWLGIRRFAHGGADRDDLMVEVMAVAVAANLTAFMFSSLANGTYGAREIAVTLPLSAALAGRLLAARLTSGRLLPALAVVLLGYTVTLAQGVVHPTAAAKTQHIVNWLVAQHFRYGLSAYGPASSITLASGQRVQVRPADQAVRGKVGGEPWESKASWYDPGLHNANFVVLDLSNPNEQGFTYTHVVATFGPPARTYRTGTDLVLVWHKNLLAGLRCGYVEGRPTAAGTSSQMTRCR